MRPGGIATLSIYGLGLIGGAFALAERAPLDGAAAAQAEACIRDQFIRNGFEVSSSGTGTTNGAVKGQRSDSPPVTVFFNKDDSAEVRIGDLGGRYSVGDVGNRLAPVQDLTDAISSRCLRPWARKDSGRHIG